MALQVDREAVPELNNSLTLTEEKVNHKWENSDHVEQSDIVFIPQPMTCGRDPLTWSKRKKYYQLLLVALYACAFSFGRNTLGATWTTVSKDTGVSLTNMNSGSALNYLLLIKVFVNIWWMPTANILGRKLVFLVTTCLCLTTGFWLAAIEGTVQWMLNMIVHGIGTSAHQAIIQLTIFDMFFVHERGRMLSVYLFPQQLGSILGLISGGSMSDIVGWRWSQNIVGFIFAFVLTAFTFTFEETLFPRFLFAGSQSVPLPSQKDEETAEKSAEGKRLEVGPVPSQTNGIIDDFPKRSYRQILKPCVRYPQNKTTFWQYFRRPFFLWGLPNVVIVSRIHICLRATAGIVSFNTISEILTEPPYNFSTTHTGLVFFAGLVGDFIGWGIGVLSDQVVITLARRSGGVKEPEMRLYTLVPCFVFAAIGYMLYGWGAQTEARWITIAIGIGAMISPQVGPCTIATAYAMDCFPGTSGELVVVLAMCSSMVNFAISYSVQPLIEAPGYGWTMTCSGAMVLLSVLAAISLVLFEKRWRIA